MEKQVFSDVYNAEEAKDAILNEEFKGFKEDYLALHCLLRKYKPKSLFEIGTNMGTGTKIIKNALGLETPVFSLDLPTELAHVSLQHPISEGKGDKVGSKCDLPFAQLRGDSMEFDYSSVPCEAYFIDGEHDYEHPHHETKEVLKTQPNLIIWHDSDMEPVYNAIVDAFEHYEKEKANLKPDGFGNVEKRKDYTLYRVTDTRIAYAVSK